MFKQQIDKIKRCGCCVARDMRPDEGQTEYEEVQKELSSKEEELEVTDNCFMLLNLFNYRQPVMSTKALHLANFYHRY